MGTSSFFFFTSFVSLQLFFKHSVSVGCTSSCHVRNFFIKELSRNDVGSRFIRMYRRNEDYLALLGYWHRELYLYYPTQKYLLLFL